MSARRAAITGAAAVAAVAFAVTALAQSASGWDLSLFTYGGGGTSIQSPYAVQGVIGQPVASTGSSGGGYTMQAGFLSGFLEKFKLLTPMLAKDGS